MKTKIETSQTVQGFNHIVEILDADPVFEALTDVPLMLVWLSTKGWHHTERRLRELARKAGYNV